MTLAPLESSITYGIHATRAGAPSFFLCDTAPTEIYTLSLHDALPIWSRADPVGQLEARHFPRSGEVQRLERGDRKSTRLNSSHVEISYAVFCLKKKNQAHDLA